MQTRSYSVPGISCGHCRTAITGEVSKIAGVTACDVNLDTKPDLVRLDGTTVKVRIK